MSMPDRSGHEIRAREILKHVDAINPIVVEVGVYVGDVSQHLLKHRRDLILYMVDSWLAVVPDTPYWNTDDQHTRCTQEEMDVYATMASNAVDFAESRAIILRMDSLVAADAIKFYGMKPCLIFLDADHSYEGCSADIKAWAPLVRAGGYLGGHDYRNQWFEKFGVTQAVDEFAASIGAQIETGDDTTWFIKL